MKNINMKNNLVVQTTLDVKAQFTHISERFPIFITLRKKIKKRSTFCKAKKGSSSN
jgi:hypothetical protein